MGVYYKCKVRDGLVAADLEKDEMSEISFLLQHVLSDNGRKHQSGDGSNWKRQANSAFAEAYI